MKREQINYLSKRVKQITNYKLKQIENSRKIGQHKVFEMEFDERYKLIAAGKAKLKPRDKVNYYTDLKDAYLFPGEEEFYKKRDKENSDIQSRYEKVQKECDKLLDQINIEENAANFMEMLQKFVEKKF